MQAPIGSSARRDRNPTVVTSVDAGHPRRHHTWRRRSLVLVMSVVLSALSVTACATNGHPVCTPRRTGNVAAGCGARLGIVTAPNTLAALAGVERTLGLHFSFIYRFHDLNDAIPTADEVQAVKSGRTLHVSIDARVYRHGNRNVPWREVASGRWDTSLAAQARGIASLKAPVYVTFDHEPDLEKASVLGTPAEFVDAWRHVHQVFERAGARNAVWVWVVTGYAPTRTTAAQMWPGNGEVDWISWEAYNASNCRIGRPDPAAFTNFEDTVLPFYRWIKDHGAEHGIDTAKPMMISEAGSAAYASNSALRASWYRQIPSVLENYPQIKAITLWDRTGNANCDFGFSRDRTVQAAVKAAGSEPPFTER
jgi:hypothetical protein